MTSFETLETLLSEFNYPPPPPTEAGCNRLALPTSRSRAIFPTLVGYVIYYAAYPARSIGKTYLLIQNLTCWYVSKITNMISTLLY